MKSKHLLRIIILISTATSLVFVPILINTLFFSDDSARADSTSSPLPELTHITYLLDWDWAGATPQNNGQGWTATNNLGYKITVMQGYLVNRNIEMVACPHDDTVSQILWQTLWPQPASAGHGDTIHDKSKITIPIVESLTNPSVIEIETTYGVEPSYCQAHYLVALGIDTAKNLPADINMLNKTLFIAGTYTAPGADQAVPFTLTTDLAWGTLTELISDNTENQMVVIEAGQSSRVIIRRNLGAIFDNVDFEQMLPAEQGKNALRSLINSTKIVVIPVDKKIIQLEDIHETP